MSAEPSWAFIIALVVSVPVSVALGYSFGPPLIIPILAAVVVAVNFIGKPTELVAARWAEMSRTSIIALDFVIPLVGLSALHGFLFTIGAIAKLGSDLSV